MLDPELTSANSIMPAYPHLFENELDISNTAAKVTAMRTLGVPYPEGYEDQANQDLKKQSDGIVQILAKDNIKVKSDKEIVALIAYLQRLGTDIKIKEPSNH